MTNCSTISTESRSVFLEQIEKQRSIKYRAKPCISISRHFSKDKQKSNMYLVVAKVLSDLWKLNNQILDNSSKVNIPLKRNHHVWVGIHHWLKIKKETQTSFSFPLHPHFSRSNYPRNEVSHVCPRGEGNNPPLTPRRRRFHFLSNPIKGFRRIE